MSYINLNSLAPVLRVQGVERLRSDGSANFVSLDIGGQTVITSGRVLQNVTANAALITAGILAVARGGTGISDPTAGNLLVGAGTAAMTLLTPVGGGFVRSDGTAWVRSAIQAADLPTHSHSLTADVTGILPAVNGGTGVASPTASRILLTAGASAMTLLAPGTSGWVVKSNGTTFVSAALVAGDLPTHSHSLTADVTGILPVANGGTGLASPTAGRLLVGAGTSAMTMIAPTTAGTFVRANGTTFVAAAIAAGDLPAHTHNASDINAGTLGTARLGTGTANSTTFLRGDQTWQTISADPVAVGRHAQLTADAAVSTGFQTCPMNFTHWSNGLNFNSSGVFTVVTAGVYEIHFVLNWSSPGGKNVRIWKNGTTAIYSASGSQYEWRSVTAIPFAVNDTIQFQVEDATSFLHTPGNWAYIVRIGA